ncbi:MAG: DNA/RNA non-specific endonuclease [Lachnospiraceae bacterium]
MSRYRKPKRNKTMTAAMALVALFMGMAVGRVGQNIETQPKDTKYQAEEQTQQEDTLQLTDDLEIPVYAGQPYTVIKDNVPDFTEEEKSCTDAFEYYGDLDTLGRCTVTFANVCSQTQPTEKRGTIGQVRPSGWHTVKYNDLIDGNYLYNRCHLIGYQLTGENANVSNLITGTRYLNVEGMLPFEDMVDDYVDETGNHVLYRVTPIFKGDELVARGVRMEAWSVEDAGTGICFDVFCYNVQPGIVIDYATGDSQRE